MFEGRIRKNIEVTFDRSLFGIRGAIDQAIETCLGDGPGTHETRFKGDIESAAFKRPHSKGLLGRANGFDLDFRRNIELLLLFVSYRTNNLSVLDEVVANRHFALFARDLSGF